MLVFSIYLPMYPFSFAEVLTLLKLQNSSLSPAEAFQLYLMRGGFPFLYNYPFSVGSLVKYLKNQRRAVSTETIYNYIEYCRSACLLHLVQRQDLAGKALLATQEKIYLADHGIREALYGNNQRDINQVIENIVYMELLRRGYEVTVGKAKNAEVDFCARKSADTLYVQVCYLLAGEGTMEREFGVLESISDNYPKYVLSLDEINRSRNGILHRHVRDFLLEPSP